MRFSLKKIIKRYPVGREITVRIDGKEKPYVVSGYSFYSGAWYISTKEGESFLYPQLEIIEKRADTVPSIGSIMSDIRQAVCDNYCKYPDCYDDEETLWTYQCSECPLNWLK